ncbi:hypothetical protein U9M48_023275 [Paspalum notatum var. saurae]|uniref:DUF7054 domain-containing protein n=1 Tax=Paspalum notatum var. saurae TaxID=547442 RepID=A0AAQ3TJH9_PASNO
MPPRAPTADQRTAGARQWRARAATPRREGEALGQRCRSASFHGHEQRRDDLQLRRQQRPRTHPDLLAGVRDRGLLRRPPATHGAAPSKVLVTVAVHRSMWPLQVMARAEWRVADLVAAAVGLYVREGRRPLLPSADPSAFGLHYSQFSLQSLDPEEKLMELGSRSFFLCPKAATAVSSSSASTRPSTEASKNTATSSANKPNMLTPWLSFMHFWPLM